MRWCCEGDPGALHSGVVASGDDGTDPWRGSEVALAMNTMFVVHTVNSPLDTLRPGPEAGHRWS